VLNVLCVVGTRPEAIKMSPVVRALRRRAGVRVLVCSSGQHRDLLQPIWDLFDVRPDFELHAMEDEQSLSALTARLFERIDGVVERARPDWVLAQGDTTTVLVAALVAHYRRARFGHVEAGLRTGDLYNPFPEEANRVLASRLTRWHFAPTEHARANLMREGIADRTIHVTGNTVIDALLDVAPRAQSADLEFARGKRLIVLTAHRRENFGAPMEQIFGAVRAIVDRFEDVAVLYPVHPNPNVKGPAERLLGGHPRVRLVAPLQYEPFVAAMKACTLLLTDSGGVQEEGPALGKPVLVLRSETERPEAIEAGVVRLVGTGLDDIVSAAAQLLSDPTEYARMAKGASPYGDGRAGSRIVEILARELRLSA
jgi:UDP-N-acetylglucosamine 2-epimerase (non-hydrolysing)